MGRIDDLVWCAGCGGEILLTPVYREDYEFCCQDCADGLCCWCDNFWLGDKDDARENHRPWLVGMG